MDRETLLYERKELSKAMTFAVWGIVGCIIPLLGVIFGAVAIAKASHADSGSSKLIAERKRKVKTAGIIAVVLSVIFMGLYALAYYLAYQNAQAQQRLEVKAQQDEAMRQEQSKAFMAADKQRRLDTCLNKAYTDYKAGWDADVKYLGTDGRLPSDYANAHESRHRDAKDDCYRRADAGTLPALNF